MYKYKLNFIKLTSLVVLFFFIFSFCDGLIWAAKLITQSKKIYMSSDLGSGISNTRFIKHPLGPSINVKTGNLFLSYKDFEITAPGFALEIDRHYNSQSKNIGLFGHGWSSQLDMLLENRGQKGIFIRDADGFVLRFTQDTIKIPKSSGQTKRNIFVSRARGLQIVEKLRNGNYQWIDNEGNTKSFDNSGKLIQLNDRNGNTQKLIYENKQLTAIQDSTGRRITFSYDPSYPHFIARAKDPIGREFVYRYNEKGDLTQVVDPSDNTSKFLYKKHELYSITYPHLAQTEISYKGKTNFVASIKGPKNYRYDFIYKQLANTDKKTTVTDLNGAITTYEYKKSDSELFLTDALGGQEYFQYEPTTNKIIYSKNPRGAITSYEYDNIGRMIKETKPLGYVTRFSYSGEYGNEIKVTGPSGDTKITKLDNHGNVISVTDEGLKRSISFSYDSFGNLIEIVKSKLNKVTLTYDKVGNLVLVTDSKGQISSFDHDLIGRILQISDARGNKTKIKYDRKDNITQITDPLNHHVNYKYNGINKLTKLTDRNGNQINYIYNDLGKLQEAINPLNNRTQFFYGKMGSLIRHVDTKGHTTHYEYDRLDRIVAKIDPLKQKWEYQYDPADNLTLIKDPLKNIYRYQYNLNGDLISVADPSGNNKELSYNPELKILSVKDFNGMTYKYTYDSGNRLVEVIDPLGHKTTYTYDFLDNITQVTDINGAITKFNYDSTGKVLEKITSSGKKTKYEYDAAGNLILKIDANGKRIKYDYNPLNRLSKKIYPDGSMEQFNYDANGNLLEEKNKDITILYKYNKLNKVQKVEYLPYGISLSYSYNSSGLRTKIADSASNILRYTYDPLNRIKEINDSKGVKVLLDYDPLGKVTHMTYSNGTNSNYIYNSLDQLVELNTKKTSGEIISRHRYTHDSLGNILSTQENDDKQITYKYDELSQLVKVTRPDGQETVYNYLPNGDRQLKKDVKTTINYTYNTDGQLIKAGDIFFHYDNNGNLLKKNDNKLETVYQYNYENRLTGIHSPDGQITKFGYAPSGKRIWKNKANKVKYYIHDFYNVFLELNEKFNIATTYIVGDYIDQSFGFLRNGKTYFYYLDRLGSITSISDQNNKTVASYQYDEYGQVKQYMSEFENSFTYTGREYDSHSFLHFYRTRYYDPSIGRFLSPDNKEGNITKPLSLNRYIYVENNPLKYIDPLGTMGGHATRPPGWRPPGLSQGPGSHRPNPGTGIRPPLAPLPPVTNPKDTETPIPGPWLPPLPDEIKPPPIPDPRWIVHDPKKPWRKPKKGSDKKRSWEEWFSPLIPSPETIKIGGQIIGTIVVGTIVILTLPEQVAATAIVIIVVGAGAGSAEAGQSTAEAGQSSNEETSTLTGDGRLAPPRPPPTITADNDATCDGVDDDGDGAIDEDYVVIQSCGVGACKTNSVASKCLGGQEIPCIPGEPTADDQTCNGQDDDCDGAVDEDYVATDTTCGLGVCVAAGQETCEGGSLVDSCEPGAPTGNDADCNNIDENCDGTADEGYMDTTCGIGACNTNNTPGYCFNGVKISCVEGLPANDDTTLNGIDDDCDGAVDEDAVASIGGTGDDGEGCTGNTELFNGQCVPKCGRSESRDASGNCIFDPGRDVASLGGPTCMSNADCPENHICVNYKCIPSEIHDKTKERVRERQGDGPESGPLSGATGGGDDGAPTSQGDYGKSECSYDADCPYDYQICQNKKCVSPDSPPYPPPRKGDQHGEDVEDFVDDFIRDGDKGHRGRDGSGGTGGRGGSGSGSGQGGGNGGGTGRGQGGGGTQTSTLPECSSGKGKCCSPVQESGGSSTEKPYWALFAFPAGECANYIKVQFSGKEGRITPEEWMKKAKSQYGSGIGCLVTKGTKSQVNAKADGICSGTSSQSTGQDCATLKKWWLKRNCDQWLSKNPNDPIFSSEGSYGVIRSMCKKDEPQKKQCEQRGKW